mgnify:FL=1
MMRTTPHAPRESHARQNHARQNHARQNRARQSHDRRSPDPVRPIGQSTPAARVVHVRCGAARPQGAHDRLTTPVSGILEQPAGWSDATHARRHPLRALHVRPQPGGAHRP